MSYDSNLSLLFCGTERHLQLDLLLGCRQHDVARVVVHAQLVDKEPAPNQAGEILHHGTGQEQHLPPLLHENHLQIQSQECKKYPIS